MHFQWMFSVRKNNQFTNKRLTKFNIGLKIKHTLNIINRNVNILRQVTIIGK